METIGPTPLEPWIAAKIGQAAEPLDPDRLREYQLDRLNQTLRLVKERSRFYARLLRDRAPALSSLEELTTLPFTTADDLRAAPCDLLCVRQDDVERIVTLPTSGTTGPPKRVFFTAEDQELTRDFFRIGMSTLVGPGDRVLILLPGATPGSVGALLKESLARMDVEGIVHGPVADAEAALRVIAESRPTALVGIPVQVLELALMSRASATPGIGSSIHSVLLSTDRMPPPLALAVQRTWNCLVFDHYGMTEMGLGGGVDCRDRSGYHLREADLLFEVVDPGSGLPVPAGESGEVVFTTLTREAMPLVRYRTGDIARFIPEPCPCGTVLRRMEHIHRRAAGPMGLSTGEIHQRDLDDRLFSLDGVADFRASIVRDAERATLTVRLRAAAGYPPADPSEVQALLMTLPVLSAENEGGRLRIEVLEWVAEGPGNTGTSKRAIELVAEE